MPVIIAALVVVGLLCLLNLMLTVGILRRMRADAEEYKPDRSSALRAGSAIGAFEVTTTDGEPITDETLAGTVAFFSAGCTACHGLLPDFLAYARERGRGDVLAIVAGDEPDMVSALAEVSRVVTADLPGGPVAKAFRNTWTPALYLVSNRVVLATGAKLADLPRRPVLSGS
ncbi:thioredoxin domain-containing protein [Hamadaea tsunoensis]|uniref:TlpA family protein n=1 Tax=Hamadaea tsunoensis TaxID=53368 RepID=UPI0004181C53|nr:TlpA family protein [Hamadaea tsunoensis]